MQDRSPAATSAAAISGRMASSRTPILAAATISGRDVACRNPAATSSARERPALR